MLRQLIGTTAMAALATSIGVCAAAAFDEAMYPNWKGQWTRRIVPGLGGQPSFDQTKPWGFGQQAPANARVYEGFGRQPCGPGQRRPGQSHSRL